MLLLLAEYNLKGRTTDDCFKNMIKTPKMQRGARNEKFGNMIKLMLCL